MRPVRSLTPSFLSFLRTYRDPQYRILRIFSYSAHPDSPRINTSHEEESQKPVEVELHSPRAVPEGKSVFF